MEWNDPHAVGVDCRTWSWRTSVVRWQDDGTTRAVSSRCILEGDGDQQERPAQSQTVHLIHRRGGVRLK